MSDKLASKGVKGANKLLNLSNSLQKMKGALALEAAAIPKIIFGEGNFTIEKLLEAVKAMDRQGLTKAGRGLAKHGGRKPTLFFKPTGNPAQINLQGGSVLREILMDPNKTILGNQLGDIKIFASEGRGAYFRKDGTFRGFIEYGKE